MQIGGRANMAITNKTAYDLTLCPSIPTSGDLPQRYPSNNIKTDMHKVILIE